MIVAAGLGTRLRPFSELRPKPVVPVRGLPLIAYQLALLAHHGVTEVVVNTHHLPEILEEATRRWCPPGLEVRFSAELELLGTGGGIRRVAGFLRESDPCLILGGDMILDADLGDLVAEHRSQRDAVTMLLRDDPRAAQFGTIGVDDRGRVRRIGRRFDLGGEASAGLYAWANVVAPRAFEALPDRQAFSHLNDWLAPLLAAGAEDIRGRVVPAHEGCWEPVGTPSEYLRVNLTARPLSYLDPEGEAIRRGTRFEEDLVIGAGAEIGAGASLHRAVVWEDERVPPGLRAADGVFAGGRFHGCADATISPGASSTRSERSIGGSGESV